MDINYIDIGKRIQEQRLKNDVTQEKLSEMVDLSVSHLSGIENGKTKFSFPSIVRIANALNTSLDSLSCGSLLQGAVILQNEFAELLEDCSPEQKIIIIDTIKAMKKSMKQNESVDET